MKTIIFDIDGTLTDMWPIERLVLLSILGEKYEVKVDNLKKSGVSDVYKIFSKIKGDKIGKTEFYKLYNKNFLTLKIFPKILKYPLVNWTKENNLNYNFVYATGGQKLETEYVLKYFKIIKYFDLRNSISKTNYPFSKVTGLPFKKIEKKYNDCILISDSEKDCKGARMAKIPFILVENATSSRQF